MAQLAKTIDNPAIAVTPEATFAEMGLDSASSAYFIVELEDWLGLELPPELVFDYPTITQLVRYLVKRQGEAGNRAPPPRRGGRARRASVPPRPSSAPPP